MNVKTLYILFFCLLSNMLLAQDTLTIYYDHDWKEISDKKQAEFYRKAFIDTNKTWSVNDYYINGQLQMTGSFTTKSMTIKNGHFVYFYENGKKSSEGDCVNNKNHGKWTYWLESGQKSYEGIFVNSKPEGLWQYWYETGEKKSEGKYANNLKDGLWKFWSINGDLANEEMMQKGQLLYSTGFYETGAIRYKENYINQKKHGESTFWNLEGKIILKGNYSNDMPSGEWVRFFPDGTSMKIQYNNNGMITGKQFGGIITNH